MNHSNLLIQRFYLAHGLLGRSARIHWWIYEILATLVPTIHTRTHNYTITFAQIGKNISGIHYSADQIFVLFDNNNMLFDFAVFMAQQFAYVTKFFMRPHGARKTKIKLLDGFIRNSSVPFSSIPNSISLRNGSVSGFLFWILFVR